MSHTLWQKCYVYDFVTCFMFVTLMYGVCEQHDAFMILLGIDLYKLIKYHISLNLYPYFV